MINAYQAFDRLKDITLGQEEAVVSFDVTAQFTSIDPDLGKETTKALL